MRATILRRSVCEVVVHGLLRGLLRLLPRRRRGVVRFLRGRRLRREEVALARDERVLRALDELQLRARDVPRDGRPPDVLVAVPGLRKCPAREEDERAGEDDPFDPDEGAQSLHFLAPCRDGAKVVAAGDCAAVRGLDEAPPRARERIEAEPEDGEQTEPDQFEDWLREPRARGTSVQHNHWPNDQECYDGHGERHLVRDVEESVVGVNGRGQGKNDEIA